MEFTSQVGQDKWVCEFFNYKRDGFFIDIGANDGKWLSNTLYLEKELGWKGICIEAGLTPFRSLVKNRSCICINKFISDIDEMTYFEEIHYSSQPRETGKQNIESLRLDTLLKSYEVPKVIDYISLDVDGPELKVLEGFPFEKFEVILWTIEHNLYLTGMGLKNSIMSVMTRNGYIIDRENVSDDGKPFEDWYINRKHARIS